jgi:hypothetical protein
VIKILISLWLCAATIPLRAQTLKTFTSPDGLFRFKHSPILIDCTPVLFQANPGSSVRDACMSQGPVCHDASDHATTIACYGYPKQRFTRKPTFIAATFFVAEVAQAKTEKTCSQEPRSWVTTQSGTATIDGINFKAFAVSDNWAGGGRWGQIYRTFHRGKCYELGLETVMSRGGYDPEVVQRFTKRDQKEIETRMQQALHSFEFLK